MCRAGLPDRWSHQPCGSMYSGPCQVRQWAHSPQVRGRSGIAPLPQQTQPFALCVFSRPAPIWPRPDGNACHLPRYVVVLYCVVRLAAPPSSGHEVPPSGSCPCPDRERGGRDAISNPPERQRSRGTEFRVQVNIPYTHVFSFSRRFRQHAHAGDHGQRKRCHGAPSMVQQHRAHHTLPQYLHEPQRLIASPSRG